MTKRKLTLNQKCKRCGYVGEQLEKHHKKFKTHGGSDANPNRIYYCNACHDYVHARAKILDAIKSEQDRITVLKKRLEILDDLNTPARIRERLDDGKHGYQGYFEVFRDSLPSPSPCVRGLGA